MIFKFANPLKFQKLAKKLQPITISLSLLLLFPGLFYSFFASPPDYLQGETVRIMYVHVPCAWFSLMIYSIIAICSFLSIIFKHALADIISRSCAPIGACFTLATLVTGSIWGKPTWGTWWVWDARLTSELVLLIIYLGLIILSNSYEDKKKGDRYVSILALIGIVNLPIIKWSVDWWNTLHQPASISKFSSPSIDASMLTPLFFMTFSFFFFFISILLVRIRGEIIQRKIDVIKFNQIR
jgi:heme exporter protein C